MKSIKLLFAIASMITVTAYAGQVLPSILAASAKAEAAAEKAQAALTSPSATTIKNDAPTVDGEVRKMDKDAKTITLKHGEIKNLDMPGMTMVFGVNDTALLNSVKVGDKVKFTAEKTKGSIIVTTIQRIAQ